VLNPLRGRTLASVDIVFVSPTTKYLLNWVANTKLNSHKTAVHSCMHSSCRAICRFCHKSSVGSRGFCALGKQGNFYASKHKFTYSGMKHCSVTKILLPSMAAYPTHINCFSSAPQRDFFSVENRRQFRSMHIFFSLLSLVIEMSSQ